MRPRRWARRTHNRPSQLLPLKRFIRESSAWTPRTGPHRSAAKRRRCELLKRSGRCTYTAWGHHPYSEEKLAPTEAGSNRDSITIANVADLPALLDTIAVKRPNTMPTAN